MKIKRCTIKTTRLADEKTRRVIGVILRVFYWLFVVGCLLLVVCCWLSVVGLAAGVIADNLPWRKGHGFRGYVPDPMMTTCLDERDIGLGFDC